MNFKADSEKYDDLQWIFLKALSATIREEIELYSADSEKDLDDLHDSSLFAISSLIDGVSSATENIVPFLAIGEKANPEEVFWDDKAMLHENCASIIDGAHDPTEILEQLKIEEPIVYTAQFTFESGISILFNHFGLDEEEKERHKELARRFFEVFYPAINRKRPNVKISDISPLYASMEKIEIICPAGRFEIGPDSLSSLTSSEIYRIITDFVRKNLNKMR